MSERVIMTLNVNGMASQLKRYRVLKLARDNKVDFLLLTETHKRRRGIDKLINDNNWKWIYESRGNSKSRGVALLIHQRVPFEEIQIQRDKDGRMLFVKGKINQKKITFAVIYAPNVNSKQFIINSKRKLDEFGEGTVFLAGDFNIQLTAGKGNKKMLHLNKLNMVDLHADLSNRSTYYSARHNKFSCIDYILMNRVGNIQLKKIEIKSIWLSDHAPLLAVVEMSSDRNQKIWRYNPVVSVKDVDKLRLQKHLCEYFSINDTGEVQQTVVWDAQKAFMRGHCISIEAHIKKRWGIERERKIREIDLLQEKVRVTRNREWNNQLKIKKKQLKLFDEIQWNNMRMVIKQRIMGWGKKSMKQMVRYLKKRKEKSCILALRDTDGEIKYSNAQLEKIMKNYYENLYKEEQVNVGVIEVVHKLTEEDKQTLNAEITNEEIIRVIKGLKPAKAPGPDGFTGEFYKTFMDELIPHLGKLFNIVFQTSNIPQTWKTSEIITIPKPDRDLRDPCSYRPISLLNQDYKIFMKVLANRIENILPKLIGEDQYGFVKGRKIYEPIRNVVNVLHHATVAKRKLGILKLDVYKAFDKVNHNYLYQLCKDLNMGDNFCETIKGIYKENTAYIRVNGHRTEKVKIQNGTKQGCPLSPMLFAMAIEVLANKIRNQKAWRGYQIGKLELKLNLFADDAIILTETPIEMIKKIMIILREFKQQSGLSVNMEKSEIICLNTGPKEQIEIRKESGLKLGCKKMKYLGVWLLKNPNNIVKVNYNLMWKKMLTQMKSWKDKKLRRMAKIRALKMMIIPKMMYLFQVLPGTFPGAKLREWDSKLIYWIDENKRSRIRKKWLFANEKDGGWGSPSLELYRDAFQIERLMELQILENNKWVRLEKEINKIKDRELLFIKWNKKEIDKLMDPLKGTIEIWLKWQQKTGIRRSKLSTLYVLNKDNETNLNKTIKELNEKGINRVEQLYEKDGRVSRIRLERWLGQQRWLQINAMCKYLNERENKEALLREETYLEKILKRKRDDTKAQASNIYRMLSQVEEGVIKGLTRWWQNELQIDEREMKDIVENIQKIKNTRVREMRRKILHKWYYTPTKLAYFQKKGKGTCWHGCQERGVFMHMIWECSVVQKFWKEVQDETNRMLKTNWTITKEMAVLVKKGDLRDFREIKIAALESAQAVIVLGWKEAVKWTIQNWYRYMVDHIYFEIMEVRMNMYNENKLKKLMERWDMVRGYMISRISDQAIKNKLESLYNM